MVENQCFETQTARPTETRYIFRHDRARFLTTWPVLTFCGPIEIDKPSVESVKHFFLVLNRKVSFSWESNLAIYGIKIIKEAPKATKPHLTHALLDEKQNL